MLRRSGDAACARRDTSGMGDLVSVGDLARRIANGDRVRLLDVRWRLDKPEGRVDYLQGHLPHAVYVDLETELAQPGRPEWGRHPLPELADLERSARRWGINDGDPVVAYDDNDGVAAARAWWLLRRRGLPVAVLDGGLQAWIREGHALHRGDHAPRPGNVTLHDTDPGIASIDDAAHAPRDGHLVDVRGPDHYRGRAAGYDPTAGHIPGAVNIPAVGQIAPDGRLKNADAIAATLNSHGITAGDRVVLYCSSGIASAHAALAFERVGVQALVYPGSWSQWSRSGRPVAVGATPAREVVAG
jgi:thiosulfate/3-mercaptopyruvate sulfurtransferase